MEFLPKDMERIPALDDNIFPALITEKEAEPAVKNLVALILNRDIVEIEDRFKLAPSGMRTDHDPFCGIICRTEDSERIRLYFTVDHVAVRLPNRIQQHEVDGLIYELCKFHSAQYTAKMKDCGELIPTYVITFCDSSLFSSTKSGVNSFSLRNDMDGNLLSDSIHFVYVEVLSEYLERPVEKMTDLEKWFVFLRNANDYHHVDFINQVIASSQPLQAAAKVYVEKCKEYQAGLADGSKDDSEFAQKLHWTAVRLAEKIDADVSDDLIDRA